MPKSGAQPYRSGGEPSSTPSATSQQPPTPAEQLSGLQLEGGWLVGERMVRRPNATGGTFSACYAAVRTDGLPGFLKAIDLSAALTQPDLARTLEALTSAYNHEKDLLFSCAKQRLNHIIRPLAAGYATVPDAGPLSRVPYLILERAVCDVRQHMEAFEALELSWALRSAHHVAVGLRQLHLHGVYHQDTKPSNILICENNIRKIGDLGRAIRQGYDGPHDGLQIAGDINYAPPELLYDYLLQDDRLRRMACDIYHLGSLLLFFFTKVGATEALVTNLDLAYAPAGWQGQFIDVLPYLRDAFGEVAQSLASVLPPTHAGAIVSIFQQLCDPDPQVRGDRKARADGANPFSLERYISRLDVVATRAELGLVT